MSIPASGFRCDGYFCMHPAEYDVRIRTKSTIYKLFACEHHQSKVADETGLTQVLTVQVQKIREGGDNEV